MFKVSQNTKDTVEAIGAAVIMALWFAVCVLGLGV